MLGDKEREDNWKLTPSLPPPPPARNAGLSSENDKTQKYFVKNTSKQFLKKFPFWPNSHFQLKKLWKKMSELLCKLACLQERSPWLSVVEFTRTKYLPQQ